MDTSNYFTELATVDCTAHVEKKGKFTYLSWPFAVAELAKRHPCAEIDVREWDGFPAVRGPKGWMVAVSVTINGIKRTQWHPILNGANQPIPEPSVFDVNTSIQRALVKAVALHGLGLYIYAGEDLPIDAGNAANGDEAASQPVRLTGNPKDGAWEGMTDEERTYLLKVAGRVSELIADPVAALEYLNTLQLDSQETLALWTRLDSKTRAALKKAKTAVHQEAA